MQKHRLGRPLQCRADCALHEARWWRFRDAIDTIRRAGLDIADPAAIRSAEAAAEQRGYARGQADEREACAGILEAFAAGAWEKVKDKPLEESLGVRPAINAALDLAAAIRARSDKGP